MWLIPSQLSDFVQASDGSTNPSAPAAGTSAGDIELRPTVNGKPTLRPRSWRGWQSRPWSQRLFGAVISDSSTARRFVDRWTASLRDSRASRGRRRGNSSGQKTTAGSGRLSFGSSMTWNPDSCSWKTSQLSLLAEVSNTCSVTLPRAGSMRSGAVSRRKPLELRTGASACSSWPTIRAKEDNCSSDATDARAARAREKYEAGEYGENSGPPSMNSLNYVTQNWPTPRVGVNGNDSGSAQRLEQGANPGLKDMAKQWATPRAEERMQENSGDDYQAISLQVQHWQSPGAMGGGSVSRGGDRVGEALLAGQAAAFSPPDPALTGAESPKRSGRRLNAAFVCWLMGAPWYWTRAEPISCGALETESWRCKVQSRLLNLCGEP